MVFREEMVSADPGPNVVPVTDRRAGADQPDDGSQEPVVAGLEAEADEPEAAEALVNPRPLVGEQPALGSVDNPG